MRSGKTAILHFVSQVTRSVAGFLATFFIARYLGATPLGIYSQLLTLLFWLKFPTDSIGSAISKRMSEDNSRPGIFVAGILIVGGYAALVAVGVVTGQEYVNAYLGTELALYLPLLLVVTAGYDTVASGLIGANRVAASGWLGTAERVVRLVCQVGLVLLGYAVLGLVLGHLLSLFVVSLVGAVLLKEYLEWPTRSSFDSVLSFAQYSWLGSLKGSALNWMDIFVLGFVVADNLIGIYQVTWTLASFLAIAGTSITSTLFPKMSSLSTRAEFDEIKHLLDEGLVFTGIFLIPGFFGALVIGDDLLRIYRPEFAEGATVLGILIGAQVLHTFGGQFVNTLNGINRPEAAFRVNAVFVGVNLLLNVGLVVTIGWYGAAIATLVSSGVYLLLGYALLVRELGTLAIPLHEISIEIFASIVMVGFVWMSIGQFQRGHLATIVIIFAGSAVYAIVLLALSGRIRQKATSFI
ncbi:polysaccharide biosynthesis C-terminal domain-containing protein [Halobacterium wangiae]|uniref:oligosaccharide flippase family protein n=1 Tax=Halobacterium wangiae TaxID=2902623 RepID=UPI001E4BF616|nr:polysaccharide biosynthesis C-terminal domain-containing protein [Halobacterium wangiae]